MTPQRTRALVLLVDDSVTQAERARQALEAAGFRVRLATNGRDALAQAHRWRPDVIVSDVLMPIMDGFALCREARRDPALAHVPIVLHTLTYVDPKDEEFALALGATRFVLKPRDPADLVGEVRAALASGHTSNPPVLAADDEAFLQGYSERLAAKLEDKVAELEEVNRHLERQYRETAAARDHLALLLETSQVVASSLDISVLLGRLAERLIMLVGGTFCHIRLLDPTGERLVVEAASPVRSVDWDPSAGDSIPLADAPFQRSVLAGNEPRVVRLDLEDCPISPAECIATRLYPARTVLFVPMCVGEQPMGLLCLGEERNWQRSPITPERAELARAMAAQAAVAIDNARLHRAQLEAEREMRLLAEVGAVFNSRSDQDEALRQVLQNASDVIAEGCALWLTGLEAVSAIPVVHHPDAAVRARAEVYLAERLAPGPSSSWDRVIQTAEPLAVPDVLAAANLPLSPDEQQCLAEAGLRSILAVPMLGPRGVVGVLLFFDRYPDRFTEAQISFARRFAERIALAIDDRRLQEELIEARSAVEAQREMGRLKNQFVGIVSHELRTPLAALVGYTELLLIDDLEEAERREFLDIMLKEGERLTSLIDELLDLQRIESRQTGIRTAPTDLRPLLEYAVVAAGQDPERPIAVDVPDDLPPVLADADRIHRVLGNLLSNARKYTPQGGKIRLSAHPAEDNMVEVAVRDQGLGISHEALPRVFEEFYRVDSADRREIKGTGLGLAISQRIVEAHGGRIWAESAGSGQGSTFRFTLHAAPEPKGHSFEGVQPC